MVLLFLLCGRKGWFFGGGGVHYTGLFGSSHLKDLSIITLQPATRVVTP